MLLGFLNFLGLFGEILEIMDNENDQQIDVGSVVEAVSADHSFGAPLYVVESMCMRCGENVCFSLSLYHTHRFG